MLEQCEERVLLATILGAAQSFAVLGASTVTNTGATAIVGDVGVSPGTAITGFPPGVVTGGAIHAGDAVAAQAHADLVTAYGVIAGEASPPANNLTGTDLGGLTLTPGVYHFDTSASLAAATTLTLNAEGDPNARFDFQVGTTLITGSNSVIQLINGAQADNVYFQVGSSATLGTGTAFEGNILADQSVTLTTGATMLDGRALALVGAVTMDTNQISQVAPAVADLSLTKTATAGPVLPGNDITYTITVANAGPDDSQAVVMSDDVPLNTTFVSDTQTSGPTFTLTNPAVGGTGTITGTIATLPTGDSATFTVVVMVLPTTPDRTIITNAANVVSTVTSDPNLANNTQTVTTDVVAEADLSLTKTATAGPVLPGDDVTYTITVANAGPDDAQAVVMTDIVPLNTTFVSDTQTSGPTFTLTNPAVGGTGTITGRIATLPTGDSATFTVVVMVLPATPDGTIITNTANVVSTVTSDPDLANNSQTVTTDVGTPAVAEADLSLTKTAMAGPVLPGDDVTYTITVANAGPDDAQAVVMTDIVPLNTTFVSDTQTSGPTFTLTNPAVGGTGTITGTITTLPTGDSATFTVVVMVLPTTPDRTIITNTANVVSTVTGDPNLANNTQTVTTDVVAEADLSLTKTATAGPVLPGDDVTYTITVANAGPDDAQAVVMTDDVPLNTTFVSDTQTSGPAFTLTNPAVGGTGTITGTIATLPTGDSATFTVVVMVLPATPDRTIITNTANVVSTVTSDPNLANNTQTVTTDVVAEADLSLTKTAMAGPVLPGDDVTYTITVANAGPDDAQAVVMTDIVPLNTTFVSDTQTSGPTFTLTNPAVGGTGTITGTITTLPTGDSATFTVVVMVLPAIPEGTIITNIADVLSAVTSDPDLANNSATVTTSVLTQADLSLTKTTAAGPVLAGTTVAYTITVANAGPSDAQTVAMTDLVPVNTTFVSDAQTSGPAFTLTNPAVGGTGTITGTIATLPTGDSATFTVVVMVLPATPDGTIITNTADVLSTATSDPNLANNTQTVTTSVLTPPTVVNLQRYGFHDQPTILVASFSVPLEAAQAEDVSNYRVVAVGRGGLVKTRVFHVRQAVYDSVTHTVTLHMVQRLNIHDLYQITINGTAPGGLMGTDGALLDGAGNGKPGSNFVRLISGKTLVGPSREAIRVGRISKARVPRAVRPIPASAVDRLAVSGQLVTRTASSNHRSHI